MTLAILTLAAALSLAPVPPVPQDATHSLESLSFMSGCWRSQPDEEGTVIEEHYTGPSANLMLGTTRYLRDGRSTSFEFSRLQLTADGVALVPYPGGRMSEATFLLTTLDGPSAVFEAPEHDFPKRILYRLDGESRLTARIDDGTDAQAFSWEMESVPCVDR